MLDVYGHLFYAGASTLEWRPPSPRGAENLVVILRPRGRSTVGATLVEVLAHYTDELERVNGRLYLAGISERASSASPSITLRDQCSRTGDSATREEEAMKTTIVDAGNFGRGIGARARAGEQEGEIIDRDLAVAEKLAEEIGGATIARSRSRSSASYTRSSSRTGSAPGARSSRIRRGRSR